MSYLSDESAAEQSLGLIAQQLANAGATPLTIELAIARLKGRKKRRRDGVKIMDRAQTQFGLILGGHSLSAVLVNPDRN